MSKQQCTINYKGKIYSQAPCEMTMEKEPFLTIKGNVPDNGVSYSVIADSSKGTALMLGPEPSCSQQAQLRPAKVGPPTVGPTGMLTTPSLPRISECRRNPALTA
jgi:hypothetical protein